MPPFIYATLHVKSRLQLLYSTPQYVFKVPHGEAEVMVSLMQEDHRSALSSVGGKNFAIGFYIMKVSGQSIRCMCNILHVLKSPGIFNFPPVKGKALKCKLLARLKLVFKNYFMNCYWHQSTSITHNTT